MNTNTIYAALDLHSERSVLGSIDHECNSRGKVRFPTEAATLEQQVKALRGRRKEDQVHLTVEAGPLTRWAAGILRPLVERLVICEPRFNRLVHGNSNKCDEQDVDGLCLLLRLNRLKEVWMGEDRPRGIYRELVYELLNWRDAQRELKALIKARYRQWGVLKLHGLKVFSSTFRKDYLDQLPGVEERRMLQRVYAQHDHAIEQWKETLREVARLGRQFWEVAELQRIPGVGPIAAHVFSAIVEDPNRFKEKHKLWKYASLGITDRSSDNKPLGYQRLDRRGNRELKNLSYHAWRTACKSTTGPNAIKSFYQASKIRSGDIRHARLNTQRKILEAMWALWRKRQPFDPDKFFPIANAPATEAESTKQPPRRQVKA